jgi:hypothetical protein
MSRWTLLPCVIALAGLAAGCGSRKAAATQTTITAFDAAKSDPQAVELADQVIATLGGAANWDNAKEVVWSQAIILDGKLIAYYKHAWDRWEGRHQFSIVDPKGQLGVIMHELFSDTKYAYVQGEKGRAPQMKEDTARMAGEATKRLDDDGYRLAFPFKLKDPGVILKMSEERPDEGVTEPNAEMKFDVIQVSFEPGVGPAPGDVWYLVIDKATKMPTMIEHVPAGRPDEERSATRLENWVEAGGLKFATKYTNVGYTRPDAEMVNLEVPEVWRARVPLPPTKVPRPGELVIVRDITVSATPDDDLYIPNVNLQ